MLTWLAILLGQKVKQLELTVKKSRFRIKDLLKQDAKEESGQLFHLHWSEVLQYWFPNSSMS